MVQVIPYEKGGYSLPEQVGVSVLPEMVVGVGGLT